MEIWKCEDEQLQPEQQQKQQQQNDDQQCAKIIKISEKIYSYDLYMNVHLLLPPPTKNGYTCYTRGDYKYFHYNCDGFIDRGWGCAYRTLQSTCSWILNKRFANDDDGGNNEVPSICEIQEILYRIGDKPNNFIGSRDWIGALEIFYVIDTLYNIPCKILHVPRNEDVKKYANILKKYFEDFGGFVMMGGDVDAGSKGIAGIHISGNQAYFLVIDPHCVGVPKSVNELIERGYIRWQHTNEFVDSSFYNLCLPQLK